MQKLIDTFEAFVLAERRRYLDVNGVGFSLAQVGRHLRFVGIAQDRYQQANDQVIARLQHVLSDDEPDTREMTAEEVEEMERDWQRQLLLHYEIVSFILFAKMLLDKAAQFVEDFFGRVRDTSLVSHDKWCKFFEKYTQAKQLEVPGDMFAMMLQLRTVIADYRDKQITHFQNPRAHHGTAIEERSSRIALGYLHPKRNDQYTVSPTVPEMTGLLETYIGQLVSLVASNRAKSRYRLKEDK